VDARRPDEVKGAAVREARTGGSRSRGDAGARRHYGMPGAAVRGRRIGGDGAAEDWAMTWRSLACSFSFRHTHELFSGR
jgi:hypothetical protein